MNKTRLDTGTSSRLGTPSLSRATRTATGVASHVDAVYDEAVKTMKEKGTKVPMGK